MIGLSQMEEYGYTWEEMLPLTKETALEMFDNSELQGQTQGATL